MRVLVTGAGFIGSHLAHRLLADNHEVLVLDNECRKTGQRTTISEVHPRRCLCSKRNRTFISIGPRCGLSFGSTSVNYSIVFGSHD
jgi:UDP-glucose 4-epimerase